jgi:hypothetical protein
VNAVPHTAIHLRKQQAIPEYAGNAGPGPPAVVQFRYRWNVHGRGGRSMGSTGVRGPGHDPGQGPVRTTRTARAAPPPGRRRAAVDLDAFRTADFAYDTTSLEYLQRLIDTVPTGPRGMRWIHQPDAVLCHAERDLDAPYDEFVSRVDIATVGRRFDGVLGSAIEILRRDPAGRTTLQLERITVRGLPGGSDPDTLWLERIDYGPDEQRIWIRTVDGSAGPAVRHDGYLAFARVAGRTRIAVLACRRFPTPRAVTLLRLDRWPWLTRALAESAARRFFAVTTANVIASRR